MSTDMAAAYSNTPQTSCEGVSPASGTIYCEKEIPQQLVEAKSRITTLEEQVIDLREALQRISDWANEAYPPESFPAQDLKRANEVLEASGISMSAMHGQWARHLIGDIGRIAKEAISA